MAGENGGGMGDWDAESGDRSARVPSKATVLLCFILLLTSECCVTCRAYLEQKELRVPWDFGMEGVSQPQDAKMTEGSMRLRLHKASSSF